MRRVGAALLSLGLLLLVAGCRNRPREPEAAQPFVFRSLNLRQQDAQGRPLWELTSPETRYDLSRRVAQSRDLKGVLYSNGKPAYRFTAANGVVLNDGEVVQLEGPTRLQRLEDGAEPLVITAQRVRWYPARELMELDRSPLATQADLRLTSQRVRFLIDADRLELRGAPTLVRNGPDPLTLAMDGVDWLPRTGSLQGRGPVRGERQLPDRAPQRLTAPSLTADTRRQIIDLQGPVRVEDPGRKGRLTARQVRIDFPRNLLTTDSPFEAQLGEARLVGDRLSLNFDTSLAVVGSGCQLSQPGDRLTAQRCQWNWRSGAVEASGGVVLRREANKQLTRADRLTGKVAENGLISFGGGGSGRVRTQLQVPRAPALGPNPAAPRGERKRPPIAL